MFFFFSSRRRHTRCALVTGVQTCALPISRKIAIRSGHRETFWKGNCVAVGLAAGFLEPLEASAIVLIELSAKIIAEQMPACREEIGRASCRERVCQHVWISVVAVALKIKNNSDCPVVPTENN